MMMILYNLQAEEATGAGPVCQDQERVYTLNVS